MQVEKKTTALLTTKIRYNSIKTNLTTYSNLNFLGADPRFVDVIGGNFELQTGSPAFKKGIDLSPDPYYGTYLKADIRNRARAFPSTLGCYE